MRLGPWKPAPSVMRRNAGHEAAIYGKSGQGLCGPAGAHRKAFAKQIWFLLANLRHPSLQAKKNSESMDVWQGRVTRGWRFLLPDRGGRICHPLRYCAPDVSCTPPGVSGGASSRRLKSTPTQVKEAWVGHPAEAKLNRVEYYSVSTNDKSRERTYNHTCCRHRCKLFSRTQAPRLTRFGHRSSGPRPNLCYGD